MLTLASMQLMCRALKLEYNIYLITPSPVALDSTQSCCKLPVPDQPQPLEVERVFRRQPETARLILNLTCDPLFLDALVVLY